MKNNTVKTMKTFASLKAFATPESLYPESWENFLAKNGHTPQTFGYLPEHLKTSMRFSFAKKS